MGYTIISSREETTAGRAESPNTSSHIPVRIAIGHINSQTTKERNESMISVMDVLVIFLSGFISAKVCDYVHELEREENEA